MLRNHLSHIIQLALLNIGCATAQNVFAHVIVGNNGAYTIDNWNSDIQLAKSVGIDGFALNIVNPASGSTGDQMALAFQAASGIGDFDLFFSFDYLGGGYNNPWPESSVIDVMNEYGQKGPYFKVDGRPFVSTFEGDTNAAYQDWPSMNQSINGGIYFVPDWSSKGAYGFSTDLVDGAFSWDLWPWGAQNMTAQNDTIWQSWLAGSGKSYMMGVSPWFFTDLPSYGKAYVWRGDEMWYSRWEQVNQLKPEFVEIVTWNDFGESHYIGPIFQPGIPSGQGSDATVYVNGYPHEGWLQTLSYQIAAYKNAYNPSNPAPSVGSGQDKIVFWYRTAPASAGSTDVTGDNCPSSVNTSPYQNCVPVTEIEEDGVFAIVLASESGTATIAIGGDSQSFSGLNPGINYISRPFNGATGNVTVSFNSIEGEGVAITSGPASGVANFNAWVGCAGSC